MKRKRFRRSRDRLCRAGGLPEKCPGFCRETDAEAASGPRGSASFAHDRMLRFRLRSGGFAGASRAPTVFSYIGYAGHELPDAVILAAVRNAGMVPLCGSLATDVSNLAPFSVETPREAWEIPLPLDSASRKQLLEPGPAQLSPAAGRRSGAQIFEQWVFTR